MEPELAWVDVRDLLCGCHLADSRSEARRLVRQGAVSLLPGGEGEWTRFPAGAWAVEVGVGDIVRVGKRRFCRIVDNG
jgi:tyrosyl-tRNA synthetase